MVTSLNAPNVAHGLTPRMRRKLGGSQKLAGLALVHRDLVAAIIWMFFCRESEIRAH